MTVSKHDWHRRTGKPLLHGLAAIPLLWLLVNWVFLFSGMPHDLGFNPQETSNRFSGDWAMRILLITLAVSPLIVLTGSKVWIQYRRMLGLWAFFYGFLHIVLYVGLDLLFDLSALWEDILKRTYITVGMGAFLLMVPLAWTSRARKIREMGAKAWKRLHTLIYIIAPLVILHFFMMRKGLQMEPLIYGAIFLALMALRRIPKRRKAVRQPS